MPAFILSAVVLLLSAIFTLFTLSEIFGYGSIKAFIEANGSLLAGILGFGGVFILVRSQDKSTKALIKSESIEKGYEATLRSDNAIHKIRTLSLKKAEEKALLDEAYHEGLLNISIVVSLLSRFEVEQIELSLKYRSNFIAMYLLAALHIDIKFSAIEDMDSYAIRKLESAKKLVSNVTLKDGIQEVISKFDSNNTGYMLNMIFIQHANISRELLIQNSGILFMFNKISRDT